MTESRLFTTSAARWDKLEEICGGVTASLTDVSNRIANSETTSREEKVIRLKDMKRCAHELAKMEAESKARCEAQKQLAHTLVNVTDEDTTDELEAVYNRDMEAAVKIAERNLRKETQEVQHIQHLLNVVQNIDGSDEEIRENFSTAQRRPTRCPILNCALENPLKNTKCGHVYSLKGAISLLFQKNAARSRTLPSTIDRVPSSYTAQCPCHGCPGVVRRDWLKRDFATELSQRQLQSVRRDSMDVEELL